MTEHTSNTMTRAWIIWSASAVFLLFQFFLQLSSAVIVGGLMESFTLTALGAGVLASTYYYIYVLLQAPAGVLIDHFGSRKLLTIGALVCGMGCFIFSQSYTLWMAVPARLIMGTGGAFAFVGSLNIIARWFPIRRFAIMVAVAETFGMFGAIFGSTLLAHLVMNYGWRRCMLGAGFLGLIISLLLWLIIRDDPAHTLPHPPKKIQFWRDIKFLAKRKLAWINGIYSGLMFCVVSVFVALWAVPFMEIAHHLTLTMAAFISNLVFIGICIGGPVIGWLDTRFALRRVVMVGGALSSAILMMLIIYIPTLSLTVVALLMLLLGFCISSYVLSFVIASEIVPPNMRSTSVGFVNMLSVGGGPLLQPLVGLLLEIVSHHQVGQYTVSQYQISLTILPVVLLLAAFVARYIPVPIRLDRL